MSEDLELTILMPCLDEAETVARCVNKARTYLSSRGITGEVLVADNGSSDNSQGLARDAGARVVDITRRGYGAALIGGINAARGRFIIMGDADDSYDFSDLDRFMVPLRGGADLVMGNRFGGTILPGAMPPLHRYLGNPVLSTLARLFFRSPIRDFHCGLRGFSRESMLTLGLSSTGMEFASEMVVKATLAGQCIEEVPITLSPDGRTRAPHLRSWRDGWRHLKFLLLMSPRWLFLYPGLFLLILGLGLELRLAIAPLSVGGVTLDIHTLLYSSGATILGVQLCIFSLIVKSIGVSKGLLRPSATTQMFARAFSIERGALFGLAVIICGLVVGGWSVVIWIRTGFGSLDPVQVMRLAIPSVTLMLAGAEVIFGSFVLGFLDLESASA